MPNFAPLPSGATYTSPDTTQPTDTTPPLPPGATYTSPASKPAPPKKPVKAVQNPNVSVADAGAMYESGATGRPTGALSAAANISTGMANAPGAKQAIDFTNWMFSPINAGVQWISDKTGFSETVARTVMGNPVAKKWLQEHPESVKNIFTLVQNGMNIAQIIPVLGIGARGVAVVTKLAAGMALGMTKEAATEVALQAAREAAVEAAHGAESIPPEEVHPTVPATSPFAGKVVKVAEGEQPWRIVPASHPASANTGLTRVPPQETTSLWWNPPKTAEPAVAPRPGEAAPGMERPSGVRAVQHEGPGGSTTTLHELPPRFGPVSAADINRIAAAKEEAAKISLPQTRQDLTVGRTAADNTPLPTTSYVSTDGKTMVTLEPPKESGGSVTRTETTIPVQHPNAPDPDSVNVPRSTPEAATITTDPEREAAVNAMESFRQAGLRSLKAKGTPLGALGRDLSLAWYRLRDSVPGQKIVGKVNSWLNGHSHVF